MILKNDLESPFVCCIFVFKSSDLSFFQCELMVCHFSFKMSQSQSRFDLRHSFSVFFSPYFIIFNAYIYQWCGIIKDYVNDFMLVHVCP